MAAFPVLLPKFNGFSFAIMEQCNGLLLDHQRQCLTALVNWFEGPNRNLPALISMPTGTGKTGVMCCLPYFLGSMGLEKPKDLGVLASGTPQYPFDKPVLVIAPGNDIADQLEGQILISADDNTENFLVKRGIIPHDYPNKKGVLPDGEKITDPKRLTSPEVIGGKDVVIANVQKFVPRPAADADADALPKKWWGEELPRNMFRLVVVDEAHHVPAPTWQRIINRFGGDALVVFLTATPLRTDGQLVVPCEFAYELSLEDARERGIIRRTQWEEVDTPHDSDLEVFKQVLSKVKEIQDQKNRVHLLPNAAAHMAIAITKTTDLANEAVRLWNENHGAGTAIAYHGGVKSELPQMMHKIRSDKVKLVVVVAMLMEGFDHPPISIAAVMTKITSPVKFVQFVGRAQRVVRSQQGQENPNIIADIVSHSFYQQAENYGRFLNGAFVDEADEN